jgi:hypothetical protein
MEVSSPIENTEHCRRQRTQSRKTCDPFHTDIRLPNASVADLEF